MECFDIKEFSRNINITQIQIILLQDNYDSYTDISERVFQVFLDGIYFSMDPDYFT